MIEKLEDILDNPLICAIAKGVALVAAVLFALLTFVVLIAAFFNVWWLLALGPCGIMTGSSMGITCYLFDKF